ncbi:MAG: hypothetical protein RLZZ490_345, partial [Cyanobacteriota bacterium]
RKDGTWRWHSTSLSPQFDPQGNVVGLFGFALDFTDRKLAELQQQQLNQELLKANQLKDEFLAMMSHELRTPLNAVLGMTESLEEEIFGPVNERQRNMLKIIYQSGSHLLSLINDILDLSKMEAGQMELERRSMDIKTVIDASLVYVQTQAIKKQIQLTSQTPDGLPAIQGDERRIRQVLINLLTNAVKFTETGGTVTLKASLVSVRFAQSAQSVTYVRLEVHDTGIGIAPENLTKLFQPFVQIDNALNRQHEGTGLGLSLVKRLVEIHGGEVGVSSEVGVGSCFWFTLPCEEIPLGAFPQQDGNLEVVNLEKPGLDSQSVPSSQGTSIPQPILLVAKDQKRLISIESYLTAKGYPVKVMTLETAIATGTKDPPLCLVFVLEKSDPDCLTVIDACRQCPPLAQTPMIVTQFNGEERLDPQPYLAAGVNHYLEPPLKLRDLVRCIQQLT